MDNFDIRKFLVENRMFGSELLNEEHNDISAEKYLISKHYSIQDHEINFSDLEELIVEFAQLHVQRALKKASGLVTSMEEFGESKIKDEIMNCYPKTNIK